MDVKLLQNRFEIPQQPFGFRRALPLLSHLLNETALLGKAHLALGDVPVGQGKLFAFELYVGHGSASMRPRVRNSHEFLSTMEHSEKGAIVTK
jgi:hypothetical protein